MPQDGPLVLAAVIMRALAYEAVWASVRAYDARRAAYWHALAMSLVRAARELE